MRLTLKSENVNVEVTIDSDSTYSELFDAFIACSIGAGYQMKTIESEIVERTIYLNNKENEN